MSEEKEKELTGVCEFFMETGTEGGYWAFHDNVGKDPDGIHWSYKGLQILKDGDYLVIFHPKKKNKILWSGVICLKQYPAFQQAAFNLWIHSNQIGVPRKKWAKWFMKEYPAKLIPAKKSP